MRGKGLLMGVKLVPNNRDFMSWARDEAKLLVAGGGDNLVRILPPLNLTLEEAREAVERFEKACEFARTKATAEQTFALPINMMSFRQPANAYERIRGMITQLYGAGPVAKVKDALGRLL